MEYNISPTLKDELDFVLTRDGVSHSFSQKNGKVKCTAELSSKQFHTAVKDALCEKKREEVHSNIPYYTRETLRDHNKFIRLQKLFWGKDEDEAAEEMPFHILNLNL